MSMLRKPFLLVLAALIATACSGRRSIVIRMSSAEGLAAGDTVVMAGVPIGRVSAVKVRAGYAAVDAVISDGEAFPRGREVVFLLTQCGAKACLRGYDAGSLTTTAGRSADSYRGTSSEIEVALWCGQGKLKDWWRAAQGAAR